MALQLTQRGADGAIGPGNPGVPNMPGVTDVRAAGLGLCMAISLWLSG